MSKIGQELLNVPFAEMTEQLAFAVANAQTKLDMNSTRVAKFMVDQKITLPNISDPSQSTDYPLIALGFFPGFYQFTEAEIEVKMAITMSRERETSVSASLNAGNKFTPYSASVNASYKSKYNYSQEGSSRLRVKLAPAPPPALLEAYMNALIEKEGKKLADDVNGPTPNP